MKPTFIDKEKIESTVDSWFDSNGSPAQLKELIVNLQESALTRQVEEIHAEILKDLLEIEEAWNAREYLSKMANLKTKLSLIEQKVLNPLIK